MKKIIFITLFAAFNVNAASPALIQLARQNNFFPGTVLAQSFKCPQGYSGTLQNEMLTCASNSDSFQIEFLKSTREILRLTSSYATTCKANGTNALKKMIIPCQLLPQSKANVGKEMVYTVQCDNFVNGELTCKPKRIDFSVGYSEPHRDLLKSAEAQANQPGLVLDGRTYLKAVSAPHIHQSKGTNVCDRLYKARAVAVIKKTKALGIENMQMKYAADSQTLSSEFYCKKPLTSQKSRKPVCPSGLTQNQSSECVSAYQPMTALCKEGSKVDIGGNGQKVDVNKDGVATEITELKKDCFEDSCYPGSSDTGKNCLMCPPGSKYNPSFKGNADSPCVKNI
jgi:hypothetical protein